jgi:hypothetical protein
MLQGPAIPANLAHRPQHCVPPLADWQVVPIIVQNIGIGDKDSAPSHRGIWNRSADLQ